MTTPSRVVSVDLGASNGRIFAADIAGDCLVLNEVHRFPNESVRAGELLYWDALGLYREILAGLRAAASGTRIASVGIDSWAVDYGLLREDGTLLGNPVTYRDARTIEVFPGMVEAIGADNLYGRTGIALQRFNTLYQLAADARAGHLDGAAHALLMPDLFSYFLTGSISTEVTNASTTQLLGVDGAWEPDLMAAARIPDGLLGAVVPPGSDLGEIRSDVASDLGLAGPVRVTATASHDTAAAVAAVPARDGDFAYISCGTWSLVGLELGQPVLSSAARQAGFTNERGIDGTIRFLRNVMGLWLLQESMRTWERRDGRRLDPSALLAKADEIAPLASVIDVDADEFLAPGDMPARIQAACRRGGQQMPETPAEVTRCILDSLAVAYRRSLESGSTLSGRDVGTLHLVGGGVNNPLLCQITADACGVPVRAGPVEAAAVGNALVQARAIGLVDGDRWRLREMAARHGELRDYEPRPEMTARYAEAAAALESSPIHS